MIIDAVQHRLYGSLNRIAWRSEDVSAVMARFGSTQRRAPASIAREYVPAALSAARAKAQGDDSRTFTCDISTAAVDRMGDSISVQGWKLDAFKKNPVVLWGKMAAFCRWVAQRRFGFRAEG